VSAPRRAARAALTITINGEPRAVPSGTTVASLLDELGLGSQPVAVERNQRLVRRHEHAATELAAGDRIEIVTFLGGG
jgi:thiamine biosynthesis protein ThiS